MWRKILAFLLIVCGVGAQGRGLALAEDMDLYAQSAVLMDADSGRILYEKDGSAKLPMASTTKIMTLTVALESGNLDDVVEVSKLAASPRSVYSAEHPAEYTDRGEVFAEGSAVFPDVRIP